MSNNLSFRHLRYGSFSRHTFLNLLALCEKNQLAARGPCEREECIGTIWNLNRCSELAFVLGDPPTYGSAPQVRQETGLSTVRRLALTPPTRSKKPDARLLPWRFGATTISVVSSASEVQASLCDEHPQPHKVALARMVGRAKPLRYAGNLVLRGRARRPCGSPVEVGAGLSAFPYLIGGDSRAASMSLKRSSVRFRVAPPNLQSTKLRLGRGCEPSCRPAVSDGCILASFGMSSVLVSTGCVRPVRLGVDFAFRRPTLFRSTLLG